MAKLVACISSDISRSNTESSDSDSDVDNKISDSSIHEIAFVVNMTHKLSPANLAKQVAQVLLNMYRDLPTTHDDSLAAWENGGERKTIYGAINFKHLILIKRRAQFLQVPFAFIQVQGRGKDISSATTVFAIFGRRYVLDSLTEDLILL